MTNKTTTTPKKLTKAQMFDTLLAIPGLTEEQIAFIDHEKELLKKKNTSGSATQTPQQKANEVIKNNILALMNADPNRLFTIGELMKEVTDMPADMTNQRMSQLVRQLYYNENETVQMPVLREEVKRKAYFKKNPNWEG